MFIAFEPPMFEAVAAFLVVLSAGILVAHAARRFSVVMEASLLPSSHATLATFLHCGRYGGQQ